MKNLRIGPRIYLIVVLLAMSGAVALFMAYSGMNDIRDTYNRLTSERGTLTIVIDDYRAAMPDVVLQGWTLLVPDTKPDFVDQQNADYQLLKKTFASYADDWMKNSKAATPAEQAKFEALQPAVDKMWVALDEYMVNITKWHKTGDKAAHDVAFKSNESGGVDVTTNDVQTKLAELVKANAAENKKAVAEAADEQQATMTRLGLVIGVILLVGIAAAVAIAASITRPLRDAVRFADTVAAGDLSAKMVSHPSGETGELTRAVEAMKESLVARMDQLREVAAVVELAADGVTSTASDVINDARSSGNEPLAEKGERLAAQAGNLKGALSAFKGADAESSDPHSSVV